MNVTGTLKVIKETQVVSDKFQKREFVIESLEQYPQLIQLELQGNKTDIIDAYGIGQEVVCDINIRGKLWTNPQGEDKYFNTLVAWKIQPNNSKANQSQSQPQQPHNSFADETKTNPKEFGNPLPGEVENDMPF